MGYDAVQVAAEGQQCTQETRTTEALDSTRRYNDQAPLVCLPDDVLIVIFLHLRDLDPLTLRIPDWVSITWVCRRFRALCLDYPLLWSCIGDYHGAWIREFTERSRSIPLEVDLHVNHHEDQWPSLERLFAHQQRMRSLKLEGTEFFMTYIVPHLLVDSPTPELTTFCLRTHARDNSSDEAMYRSAPKMSLSLFPDAPHLRSLTLSGRLLARIDPSWTPLSSSLEDIDVEGCYAAHELHTLLREVPNIRSFAVRETDMIIARSSLPTAHTYAWTPLGLPHLTSLTIETAFDERLADLLSSLETPSLRLTHLSFSDCEASSDVGKTTGLLSAVRALLTRSHGGAKFQSLRFSPFVAITDADLTSRYALVDSTHMWHDSAMGTDSSSPYERSTADARVTFKSPHTLFRPIPHVRDVLPFYRHLCEVLPVSGVRTLTIDSELASSAQGWTDILRTLACVEEMKIIDHRGRLSAALHALILTPFVLPALSRFGMCFCFRTSFTPPPLLEGLRGVARARMKGEKRLRVAFEGCPRYLPALDNVLREIADVTWDNVGFFDDGNSEDGGPWFAFITAL
ncbi:unnamed protein product [Peniophora sp. CBMAI 1063]|nr:unnamed protein product [Peniophora sp. CBMAI 1063]